MYKRNSPDKEKEPVTAGVREIFQKEKRKKERKKEEKKLKKAAREVEENLLA